MKDCGSAVSMKYGTSTSGALTNDAAAAFIDNFSYDAASLLYMQRDLYSQEEWMQVVYSNLQAKRPILYSGVDLSKGGHAFVLDGIDENGLVHVNWGWDGSYDGYYDISLLNSQNGSFAYNQGMIAGLNPQKSEDINTGFASIWGTDTYTASVEANTLKIDFRKMYNYHYRKFSGSLNLCVVSNTTSAKTVLPLTSADLGELSELEVLSMYGWNVGDEDTYLECTADISALPQGKYTIYMSSSDARDTEPQPVRCTGGAICYTLTVNADGTSSLSDAAYITAGILSPIVKSHDERVYNLSGQRVPSNTKGFVVANGKKEFRK